MPRGSLAQDLVTQPATPRDRPSAVQHGHLTMQRAQGQAAIHTASSILKEQVNTPLFDVGPPVGIPGGPGDSLCSGKHVLLLESMSTYHTLVPYARHKLGGWSASTSKN